MGIKVKAIERNVNFTKKENGEKAEPHYLFVMQPELYSMLADNKVIAQAALNCGMPPAAMESCVKAYTKAVADWATEGHSIPIPGLGTLRFGVRSKAVEDVTDVKSSLITSRRFIFTPSTELKKALEETSISITCYDRNGKIVKTVTSDDKNDIEDPDKKDENAGGEQAGGSQTNPGSSTQGGGSSTGSESSGSSSTGGPKEFD